MPKRKSAASRRTRDAEQDQTNQEPEARDCEARRILYTRSAKDAAKERILRCFKTKPESRQPAEPRPMDEDESMSEDSSGESAEGVTMKRPRIRNTRDSVEPSCSRRPRLEDDSNTARSLGSATSQVRRTSEFEGSLPRVVSARNLIPSFVGNSGGEFPLPRPFNLFHSYRQLLIEVPLGSRRVGAPNCLTDRLTSLLSALESGPSAVCSSVLTELCQFLLLNNEDSLPNFPSRYFVTVVTKFLPPYQEDQSEDNAILACRALSCVCEVISSSVGSVARAVPCLINCLSKFNAVDVPEQALNTLEILARQQQARAILLNNGVALSLKIFDFLSPQAVLSVLTIASHCAAVVRPSLTEFKLIVPFLDFAEKGLALQDAKLSLLVCRAIYRLVVNLRADPTVFKRIAENQRFVSTLNNMLISGHWTNYPENKFLLVRTLCALYAGSSALVNEVLNSSTGIEKALRSLFLEGVNKLHKNVATNPYESTNIDDELLDILTLIDVFIPPVETDEDSFLKEEGFSQRCSNQVLWQWRDDNNGWQTYNVTECWTIETDYFNNMDEVPLRIDNRNYAVDFEQMLQVNEETGTARAVQRIVDECEETIHEHAVVDTIIEALCQAIYNLSINSTSYLLLLCQRCWTLLTRIVVYASKRQSCGSGLRLPDIFQGFDEIGACLYSLLTSDCPLLVICALKTIYALLKCCTKTERSSWGKRFIADGIVEALEALSEHEQQSRRRSVRNRHIVTTTSSHSQNDSSMPSSWSNRVYECSRYAEATIAPYRNLFRSRGSENQSRFSPAQADLRSGRPSSGSSRQTLQPTRVPVAVIHKWIKSRAARILSQFKESFRRSDPKLDMLRDVCEKISREVDEEPLCQLATMLGEGTTVFQMFKSDAIKAMLSTLSPTESEENKYLLMRLRLFLDVFSRGDNGKTNPLTELSDKLNACINFTEKFTSSFESSVLPSSSERSNLFQSFGNGILVSFVEIQEDSADMIPEGIGPIMCTHETKIGQIIPTLSYYLGSVIHEDMSEAYGTQGSYAQPRLELFYAGHKLEPEVTLSSLVRHQPVRSIQLQYRTCDCDPKTCTSSSPSASDPQSWLLSLLSEHGCSVKDPSIDAVLLIRLIALLSKHQHLICPRLDLALPDSLFVNWKLSATVMRILRDPIRLVGNEPCPEWLRCLSYDCFPIFPFELRQMAFYALNYPHSRLLNRFAEVGLINSSHGLEHYGRMEKKKFTIKRDKILSSAEDIFSKLSPLPMLEISYENEIGHGNGPTHEFFALVGKELVGADIWASSETSLLLGLVPVPMAARCSRASLSRTKNKFRFIGKLMAKCIFDFKMLDLPLNVVVYKWLLRQEQSICLNDLKYVDPDLYRQLRRLEDMALYLEMGRESRSKIREYEKEIDSLYLDFTLPGYPDIELTKNGRNQAVTLDNVREFIKLVVDWRLVEGIRRQMEALREGFQSIMKLSWLRCFHADELHMLVCGSQHDEWTFELLAQYTRCDHGYSHDSQQVQWLFSFMCSLDRTERRLFLQFITGTPCLPVGGIKCLSPPLTIVKSVESHCADETLPSVMTCRNYLKLPAYSNFEALQNRFRLAMSEGQESFHLS